MTGFFVILIKTQFISYLTFSLAKKMPLHIFKSISKNLLNRKKCRHKFSAHRCRFHVENKDQLVRGYVNKWIWWSFLVHFWELDLAYLRSKERSVSPEWQLSMASEGFKHKVPTMEKTAFHDQLLANSLAYHLTLVMSHITPKCICCAPVSSDCFPNSCSCPGNFCSWTVYGSWCRQVLPSKMLHGIVTGVMTW